VIIDDASGVDAGTPITLAFSRMVSEVPKQVGPEMPVRSEYSFYM
jgi:hypothetical protein